MSKNIARVYFGILVFMLGNLAYAVPPDFSSLTAAIDYTTVIAAILLAFAGLAGVALVWAGGGMIVRALKKS